MNTRMNHLNPLCAALRGAHLVRAGAMLALALGAAQAGATTYTVPLQFNITLTAPVCSLTVGSSTANAATPVQTTGPTVDLTPSAISAINNPAGILNAMATTTGTLTANGPGVMFGSGWTQRAVASNAMPSASATCTLGTPMIVRLSKISTAQLTGDTSMMAGTAGAGQTGTLPIGMVLGIASFSGVNGTSGVGGTTYGTTQPSVSATATGLAQPIVLAAGLYAATNGAMLTASSAGLWTYSYNVNLDF